MNIEKPEVARLLAKLIQPVDGDYRNQFVADSIEAKNMKEFLEKYKAYKKF